MKRADLIDRMAGLAVDLDAVTAPTEPAVELTMLCRSARLAFGAAAVSVASLADGVLTFLASSGEGADLIVGTQMPVSRGIAGYVAVTGQAMAIDRPTDDPRFARDVAERTGYLPDSLLVVPIDETGSIAGVLSVLDRSDVAVDALALATAFAAQAAPRLGAIRSARSAGRTILAGVIGAIEAGDDDLGAALRRATRNLPDTDRDLAGAAVALAELRRLDGDTRAKTLAILADVVDLAATRRRR
jgi:hypothetical protein